MIKHVKSGNILCILIAVFVSVTTPVFGNTDVFDIKVLGNLGSIVRKPAIQKFDKVKIKIKVNHLGGQKYPKLENQLQILANDFFSERKRFAIVSDSADNSQIETSAAGEKLDLSKITLNIVYQPVEATKVKIGFVIFSLFNGEIIAEKSIFIDHSDAETLFSEAPSIAAIAELNGDESVDETADVENGDQSSPMFSEDDELMVNVSYYSGGPSYIFEMKSDSSDSEEEISYAGTGVMGKLQWMAYSRYILAFGISAGELYKPKGDENTGAFSSAELSFTFNWSTASAGYNRQWTVYVGAGAHYINADYILNKGESTEVKREFTDSGLDLVYGGGYIFGNGLSLDLFIRSPLSNGVKFKENNDDLKEVKSSGGGGILFGYWF